MKKIYESIKGIISEGEATKGVSSLKDPTMYSKTPEKVTTYQLGDKTYKKSDPQGQYDAKPEETKDLRGERSKWAVYNRTTKKNDIVSVPSPTPGQLPEKDPETIQQTSAKLNNLSPFGQAFSHARTHGEDEFTWGKANGQLYSVGTKLKGEGYEPKITNVYEAAKEILSEKHNREDLEKEAQRLSKLHNVPYEVTKHVINKETGGTWKTNQVNPRSGATGIMQILPKYATNTPAGYEVDKKDLFDPYKSMNAGIKKLGQWYNTHRNKKLPEDQLDVAAAKKAMASYNAGPNGGIEKDKQGKVKYVGAATYIKTGNPKHLPLEAQNYIKDFGVDNRVASNKSDKPFKRDASAMKAQIDPKQHEIKDNRPQANTVPAPVVQSKPAQEAPKKEVKVNNQQPATQSAAPEASNYTNQYEPGTFDYEFKKARDLKLKSFKDPNTGKEVAVKLKEESGMKNVYGAIKDILSEAKKEIRHVSADILPSRAKVLQHQQGVLDKIQRDQKTGTYGITPLSSNNYLKIDGVSYVNVHTNPAWGGKGEVSIPVDKTAYDALKRQQADAADKARGENEKGVDLKQVYSYSPSVTITVPPNASNTSVAKSKSTNVVANNISKSSNTLVVQNKAAPQANTAHQQKASSVKKELSPFEKEFARARAAKETEFTWHDEKGRAYKVGTKLKGETNPPEVKKSGPVRTTTTRTRSITPSVTSSSEKSADSKSVEIPPEEMDKIDAQIDAQKNNNAVDANSQDQNTNSNEPEKKRKFDFRKGLLGQDNSKTNEETQMSINKKFNVSDSLYAAVMEVMKKPSQGSAPRNEKEKELAAMSPPGHLITHGDVLKARGVKMKEDVEQTNESLANTIVTLGKTVGLFRDDEQAPKKNEKKQAAIQIKPNMQSQTP